MIKSYTDLQQSRKLAEILPLESADMYYLAKPDDTNSNMVVSDICIPKKSENDGRAFGELYAWSLAALLSVLPMITKDKENANPFIAKTPDNEYYVVYATLTKEVDSSAVYDNPVDACVAMIIRLNELNLL